MPRAAPHNYVTRATRPADFDEFWQDVLDQADRIPLKSDVVPDPLRSTDDVDVFQVFYDSLDHVRVAGMVLCPQEKIG